MSERDVPKDSHFVRSTLLRAACAADTWAELSLACEALQHALEMGEHARREDAHLRGRVLVQPCAEGA